jgi:hypothetical protein
MEHGHRRPAVAKADLGFKEGSLLPPDPKAPYGEVKINFAGVTVRVPFAGMEPTAGQLLKIAFHELRKFGQKPPHPDAAVFVPRGEFEDLEFDLVAV